MSVESQFMVTLGPRLQNQYPVMHEGPTSECSSGEKHGNVFFFSFAVSGWGHVYVTGDCFVGLNRQGFRLATGIDTPS